MELQARRAKSGGGVLGRGSEPLSQPTKEFGERCKLSQ